ncbi:MAG: D-lactate dehydrogenase [Colwellia sp.]|jgi:D-lactate dehydrogenase
MVAYFLYFKRTLYPASINTCKIAGIAANNASGMCCGIAQNSDHTLDSIRVVLHDGSVLDTSDKYNVTQFKKSHVTLLDNLKIRALKTRNNKELHQLISHKYRLKNTTGYAINSLIYFKDPINILAHLMIGSEGTLGFISFLTYNTVIEHKYRASSLALSEHGKYTILIDTSPCKSMLVENKEKLVVYLITRGLIINQFIIYISG